MIRAFILFLIPWALAFLMGSGSCDTRDPDNPGTGGTGGEYWNIGGTVSTGGAPSGGVAPTGGTAGTGGEVTEANLVCDHLAALGCPEGLRATCVEQVKFYGADERFGLDTACLLAAQTKTAVRDCGSIPCEDAQ